MGPHGSVSVKQDHKLTSVLDSLAGGCDVRIIKGLDECNTHLILNCCISLALSLFLQLSLRYRFVHHRASQAAEANSRCLPNPSQKSKFKSSRSVSPRVTAQTGLPLSIPCLQHHARVSSKQPRVHPQPASHPPPPSPARRSATTRHSRSAAASLPTTPNPR